MNREVKNPLIISLIYCLFGVIWILFSDAVFLQFISNISEYQKIQNIKGILYVITSSLLVFALTYFFFRKNVILESKSLLIQKKSIEDLEKSEKYFKALVENDHSVTTVMDEKFNVIYRSPASEKVTGWTNEERNKFSSEDLTHPEDVANLKSVMQLVLKTPDKEIEFKTRTRHKNGNYIWLKGVVVNRLANPLVKGIITNLRDVTPEKLAKLRLEKSENLFKALIENTQDIISLTNKDGNLIYVSPALERITGFTFQEMKDRNVTLVMHPDYVEGSKEILKEVLENPGTLVQRTNRFLHKDGHYIWAEGTVINLLQDKNVNAIVSNYRDVTDRVNAEKKATESNENLKAIFENTLEGFILLNLNSVILDFNSNAKKLGFEAYGKALKKGESLYDFIHESRVDFLKDAISKVQKGGSINYDKVYDADGKKIWIDFFITPVFENKKVSGVCIAGRDITEKKQIEQEREFDSNNLASLINNTRDLMWSIDSNFKLITFNEPFRDIVKSMSGQTIQKGDNVFAGFDAQSVKKYTDYYKRALTGEGFTILEYSEVPSDFWSEISFNPIFHGEQIIGTSCHAKNITEFKKIELSLKKNAEEKETLIKELIQNNKDIRQFSYITSHNLRGPIASLLGLTSLLANHEIKDKSLIEILGNIRKSAFRFDETIKDLSEVLSIKDNISIPKENLKFEIKLKKVLNQCEDVIVESQANIEFNFSKAEEVAFNRTYLESIFLNLLMNSIKYKEDSRILNIWIETEVDNGTIVLKFKDNGIGFDVDSNKDKLFKLYQRFNDKKEGKGLGLFLIKSQMEAMGGTIGVESKVGKGTTFILKFKK